MRSVGQRGSYREGASHGEATFATAVYKINSQSVLPDALAGRARRRGRPGDARSDPSDRSEPGAVESGGRPQRGSIHINGPYNCGGGWTTARRTGAGLRCGATFYDG